MYKPECGNLMSKYTPPSSYKTVARKKSYGNMSSYTSCREMPDKAVFLTETQPNTFIKSDFCRSNNMCESNSTYTYLNQRGVETSPFFKKDNVCGYESVIQDGRLYDTSRNLVMSLDTPPIQVHYNSKHDTISGKPQYNDYGRNYKDYRSVNLGQIQYYIDTDISQPFISPVYSMPSKTTGQIYTDPMGAKRPEFTKTFDMSRREHTNMLSSIEDTTKHREDIMSLQQQRHNEQRYDVMYNRI